MVSASSIVLGLALIATSLVGGCAHDGQTRTNSVAQAAAIAASVAICTLGDSPVQHVEYENVHAVEIVPEDLLGDDFRFDLDQDAHPPAEPGETVPESVLIRTDGDPAPGNQ